MIPCDLCGAGNPRFILESSGLDGPLVECTDCGFRYVGERRSALAYGSGSASDITDRVKAANRQLRGLRLDEERRLATLDAGNRLKLVRQFRPSGKLLEVGSARGDFLKVARNFFTAFGVEPNPELAESALVYAPVHQGVVEDVTAHHFDIITSFHVIEHVDSPKSFVAAIAERLRPGGLIVLETPDIDSVPFRTLKSRWRQFIPEHYSFFTEATMRKLLEDSGFKVQRIGHVGKHASVALLLNRLSRYFPPVQYLEGIANWLRLSRVTFELNPLDIMIAVAVKTGPPKAPTGQ